MAALIRFRSLPVVAALLLLAGCGGLDRKSDGAPSRTLDPNSIEDAVPRRDPVTKAGNKNPYTVLGKTYRILPSAKGYKARGIASWYGTKFHGESTANGERYDLYGMTAAHCTLPIPAYVLVTNLDNGKQCVVRVNDRGPFAEGRLIDLSYAAATKLGYAHKGTARVEVSAIDVDNWPPRSGFAELSLPRTVTAPSPAALPLPAPIAARGEPIEMVGVNDSVPGQSARGEYVSGTGVGGAPIVNTNAPKIDVAEADAVNAINAAQVSASNGSSGGAHYVQVGAFGSNQTAEKLRARLAASTGYRVVVQPTLNAPVLYRVRVGPFTNAIDAERAREQLHNQQIDGARVIEEAAPR
jgi:peptidoglycan lytic transglycosylase